VDASLAKSSQKSFDFLVFLYFALLQVCDNFDQSFFLTGVKEIRLGFLIGHYFFQLFAPVFQRHINRESCHVLEEPLCFHLFDRRLDLRVNNSPKSVFLLGARLVLCEEEAKVKDLA